jgi:hypothetical protein
MQKLTLTLFVFLLTIGSVSAQKPSAVLTKNGKTDPTSIPNWVAYEFFIKSLVLSTEEGTRGSRRVAAFATQAGIKETQLVDFLSDIQESYGRLKAFDKKAKEVKDKTWPNPNPEVWEQLSKLQREKETALTREVNSILGHRQEKTAREVKQFVNTYIKSRIKGYADQPNPDQMPRNHQMSKRNHTQMTETVYVYADAVFTMGGEYVYGYGNIVAGYSSYGHEYSTRVELTGPCGQFYLNDSSYAEVPLDLCDGVYNSTTTGVQFCPIGNTTQDVGNADDYVEVMPFIRINPLGSFGPLSVGLNQTSYISGSVSTSSGWSGQWQEEWGYELVAGSAPVQITICPPVNHIGAQGGQTIGISCSYKPTATTSNQTRIRAVVEIQSFGTVLGSRASTSTLLINK